MLVMAESDIGFLRNCRVPLGGVCVECVECVECVVCVCLPAAVLRSLFALIGLLPPYLPL